MIPRFSLSMGRHHTNTICTGRSCPSIEDLHAAARMVSTVSGLPFKTEGVFCEFDGCPVFIYDTGKVGKIAEEGDLLCRGRPGEMYEIDEIAIMTIENGKVVLGEYWGTSIRHHPMNPRTMEKLVWAFRQTCC